MAKPLNSFFSSFLILGLLLCFSSSSAWAKSPRPISDIEIREKKNACYADIESGLWGSQCRSSVIAKENCALRCLSPACYELIYESDPLEEGEKDYVRGQEYKYCMHKLSLGESLQGIKGSFDYRHSYPHTDTRLVQDLDAEACKLQIKLSLPAYRSIITHPAHLNYIGACDPANQAFRLRSHEAKPPCLRPALEFGPHFIFQTRVEEEDE